MIKNELLDFIIKNLLNKTRIYISYFFDTTVDANSPLCISVLMIIQEKYR